MDEVWNKILKTLQTSIGYEDFSTWIRPLILAKKQNENMLKLIAPNKYICDYVSRNFSANINQAILEVKHPDIKNHDIKVLRKSEPSSQNLANFAGNLNKMYTFENFISGKSNQLAYAASHQVAKTPGGAYNPLFIYGATGLGKTHLMHAIGFRLMNNHEAKVLYVRSERFVRDMITAIQSGNINKFKSFYHSLNTLLIDDIQFLAGKERSQEEFFHSFNYLLEGNHQVVVTCDKYPREIENIEERLISRFGSGLTVALEPPEYETRVAILISKAKQNGFELPYETACFIAKLVKSNVRELEGALKSVQALGQLMDRKLNIKIAKKALRDLISVQNKIVSINNIQKIVADYFNIRVSDIVSKSRSRSVTRPRQICMSLCKELTDKSLPEIGNSFGGRDHSTVIYACRKVKDLRDSDIKISNDYKNLKRILSA